MSNRKRGSIALARQLCYEIAGATSEDDDISGHDYGSVDIAEILSAEVVRLQAALAQPEQVDCPRCGHVCSQRPWVGLTDEAWVAIDNKKGTALDTFTQGAVWAESQLRERNT